MKKITLLIAFVLVFVSQGYSQFGCGSAVTITNGYTSGPLTTPGNAGPENWVTSVTPLAGTSASYWDDDVYLFQYTAGAIVESISVTIDSVNSWNGAGIFSTCSGTTLSGPLATQGTTGANSSKTLVATVMANQTVYIAVGQWGTPDDLDFSVTNFIAAPIVTPPNCTTLAVPANGATSISSTNISWLAATGSPTGYKVFAGTTSGGINLANGVTTTSLNYTLPAFSLSTIYYVKIVPFNANGDALACTETSFTSCGPAGNSWFENFDGVTIPALPSCWTGVFAGAAPGAQVITGSTFASSPTALRIRSDASTPSANVIAVSPYTPNLGAGTHRLVFNALTNNNADDLIIGTLSNSSDATTFTPLQNVDINITYSQFIVSFAGYTGTDKYIGFKRLCVNQFNSVYVDDVKWEPIPACLEPAGLTSSSVTTTTATVSWNATSPVPSVGYQYVVSTVATAPTAAGTATTSLTANVTGLMPQTNYSLFVRSNCGSGFSTWTGPYSFTTACAPLSVPIAENFATFLPSICWSLGQGGDLVTGPTAFDSLDTTGWTADGFANITALGAIDANIWQDTQNDWIISPQYAIPATGYKLRFDAAATQYLSSFGGGSPVAPTTPWEADDKVEVLVCSTGTTNWTVLNTFNDTNQPSFTGNNYEYNLNVYAGQNIKIAFRAVEGTTNGSADIEFSIDNLQVTNLLKTESFDLTGFSVYPNPVKDILNLNYTKDISNVSIHNLLGQEVMTKSINASQSKIDMSNLTNGTYLVKVTVDGLVKTLKVVKQ